MKAKVVVGNSTVASSQEPTVVATRKGVLLTLRGEAAVQVSLSGELLRSCVAAWTAGVMGMAVAGAAGVTVVGESGRVANFAELTPDQQRWFTQLVRGWQELAAAGYPDAGRLGEASLARWLEDMDSSEPAQVNALLRELGLDEIDA